MDFYRFKSLEKYGQCLHAVSQKSEQEPYALSTALHTGEEVAIIRQNREKIAQALGWKSGLSFVLANQTHSDRIVVVDAEGHQGWQSLESAIQDCDALISGEKNLVLAVLTADCVPILLYDKEKEVIAAVHAGWKGTKASIVAKTVQKMQECFGCDPLDIIAGIAPAIGSCCYEVGIEVAEHFMSYPQACQPKGEKYMLNLPLINQAQLLEVGLLEEHIELSNICTACEVASFFSYRKEQGCTGRFMSMIAVT